MVEIDLSGLSCPGPVIKTKELLDSKDPVRIVVKVDNTASKENVSRFLESRGYNVCVEMEGSKFCVVGTKGSGSEKSVRQERTEARVPEKRIIVMITSRTIGHGDEKLGASLMVNFVKTLKEILPNLWKVILLNEGVKLTVEGSECLPELQELSNSGVQILVCGTCLSYYNLINEKKVGETTNMLDVVTSLATADSVININ